MIADIAVVALLITNVLAIVYASVWRNRAANLDKRVDDADREADRLRATNARHVLETTRQSFEIIYLRRMMARQVAELRFEPEMVEMTKRRVEWTIGEVN